jgi:hypothetical protein
MEPENIPEIVRPYVNGQLVHLARRGWNSIGDDLVLFLKIRNSEVLAYDRNLFLSKMQLQPCLRCRLEDPALVIAARTQVLQRHAIVVWFVVEFPDGSHHAQVLTFDNEYRYTTNIIGIA